MNLNKPEETTTIEKAACVACIKYLISTPVLLSDFMKDHKANRHRKWHLYRTFYSEIKSQYVKCRVEPERKRNGGIPVFKTEELARQHDKTKQEFLPCLHLGYLDTKRQKVAKIMASDCSSQVKADLLEAHL